MEDGDRLKLKGYRFITRLENSIILASIDADNYMLFRESGRADTERDVVIRKRWHEFVKPITPATTPDLYYMAKSKDDERKRAKSGK